MPLNSSLSGPIGVLLAQTGTPAAPTKAAVAGFLKEFLSDRRVIDLSPFIWQPILRGLVVPIRSGRAAGWYRTVWDGEDSPLLKITRRQHAELSAALGGGAEGIEVDFGMRYGEPSLRKAFRRLSDKGCRRILLLPLFPQYSACTTGSCCDVVFDEALRLRWIPSIRVAAPYYNHSRFIEALCARIKSWCAANQRPDCLVLSYHGLPQRYIRAGDPYAAMCGETTRAITAELSQFFPRIVQSFQSRLGKGKWTEPATQDVVAGLARERVRSIAVFCPAFVSDCIETLYEINHELRESFIVNGGSRFDHIPCLNDDGPWIQALSQIVREELKGWIP